MLTDHGLGNFELDQSWISLVEYPLSMQKLNHDCALCKTLKNNDIDDLILTIATIVDRQLSTMVIVMSVNFSDVVRRFGIWRIHCTIMPL
jgi:hypothetical protein